MKGEDPSKAVERNQKKLLERVFSASDLVVAEMDRRFTAAISAKDWKWPNAPSPRDIVDTGALRASQNYTRQTDGVYRFTWSVPYATSVHEGGTFFDGTEMPARPWTRRALKGMREDKVIEKIMKLELKKSSTSLNPPPPAPPTLGNQQ